jgi:hypothetical protein
MNLRTAIIRALDPVYLWRDIYHTEPDPWQRDVLRSDHPRIILNTARQVGKSSTVAVKALHPCLYEPGSLVLLLSRSLRQSQELARKVFDAYKTLGKPIPADAESRLTLELTNGSRILALPGGDPGSVRGFSGVRSLIIDEAAQCSDLLYRSLRPVIAVSGGSLTLLSTPFGKRGFFFETWTQSEGWYKVQITGPECPRLSPEFLAEERRELGARWYSQEYLGIFLEGLDQVFSDADIDAAFQGIPPLFAVGGERGDDDGLLIDLPKLFRE